MLSRHHHFHHLHHLIHLDRLPADILPHNLHQLLLQILDRDQIRLFERHYFQLRHLSHQQVLWVGSMVRHYHLHQLIW